MSSMAVVYSSFILPAKINLAIIDGAAYTENFNAEFGVELNFDLGESYINKTVYIEACSNSVISAAEAALLASLGISEREVIYQTGYNLVLIQRLRNYIWQYYAMQSRPNAALPDPNLQHYAQALKCANVFTMLSLYCADLGKANHATSTFEFEYVNTLQIAIPQFSRDYTSITAQFKHQLGCLHEMLKKRPVAVVLQQ